MTSQVYNLDGPKEFPFPYPVRAAAQLTVEIVPGNIVSPGDYEVVGVGPTSTQVTVRYPNAPTTGGLQLKISRYVAPERVTVIDDPSDITTVNLNAEFNNIYEALIDFEEFILNLVQQMLDDFQNDVLDPALAEITQLRNDAVAAKDAAEAAQQGAEEAEQGATAAWDAFQDRYWGAYPTDPSTSPVGNPPTAGDLYWNTTVNQWRAWDANQGAWVSVTSAVPTYYDRRNYIATEGQTTFEATYDAGYVQVWVNGLLLPPSDYESSTGTEVVLDEGVVAGTEVTVVGLGSVVVGALDGDNAVVTTSTGTQLLPEALDKRVVHVPDLPALRALTGMQEGQVIYLKDDGDTGSGAYIISNSSEPEFLPEVIVLGNGQRALAAPASYHAKRYAVAVAGVAAADAEANANTYTDAQLTSFAEGAAGVFADTTDGLSGTTEGQYFNVPSADPNEIYIVYRHDAGPVATEIGRTPSASYVQETRALTDAPLNVGQANGWIDPFFRHLGIGETLGGQFRWYGGGAIDGPTSTLEYVNNPVFKGRALRKNTDGTVQLAGPLVSLADMGAAVGDTVTARMLVIGDGETVYFVGRWVDADGASVSGQINGDTDTVSASPTLFSMTDVVPAGAAYLRLYPYTDTAGGQFDIVALWAGKGSAGDVPVWPNYNDIDYLLNKTAQSTTDHIGQGNGWIDPFFRHLGIGEEIGDQRRWHIIGGGSLSLVDNPVFKGRALRKTGEGLGDLSGPLISVKDMSAEEGGSVAVRMLVTGNGAEVVGTGRWIDASGVNIGTQDDAGIVIAGAEPVLISWFLTVPAGAAYFRLYPYTNTVGGQFDVVSLWAGTGDVPSLPLYNDIDYLLLKADQSGGSATVPDLALPPFIYHAGDRQINTYFANMTYATAGQYQWDVDCARGDQLQECHRIEGGESVATVPITIKQQDPVSFQDLKVATGTLRMASDTAGNGVTRKLMVIGDSTTANGKMVTEIVNLFGADVMSVTMVGTQGTAPNVHEGRSGWKTTDYTGPGRTFFEFTVSGVVEEPAINATEYDHNGSTYEVQEVNLDGNGDGTLICERRSGSNDPLASGTLTKSNASDGDATISFSAWQTVAGNPFWNDGTEQLDFSAYMSANGFTMAAGDWVMIHLGINDCFSQTTDAGVDTLTNAAFPALDGLIASIRAYEPGIRVGMCVPVPPPSSQDAFAVYSSGQTRHRYMRNIHRWALNLIDYYGGQEGLGNYIIPLNTCWDTVNNAMIVTENVNSRSNTQVGRQKNGVHPHNGGYEQMADCIYSVIKYHG